MGGKIVIRSIVVKWRSQKVKLAQIWQEQMSGFESIYGDSVGSTAQVESKVFITFVRNQERAFI